MASDRSSSKTIVFVHGMFMNPSCWADWRGYFGAKGYECHAPPYPFHDGDPATLRMNVDPRLGRLTFPEVVKSISDFIDTLPEQPILIGHSMGGLIVQKLIEDRRGVAGVCIDSAPPKGVTSFEWSFLWANLPTINPLKGPRPCVPSVGWFHYAFCNTMTLTETAIAYERFVVPESRNVPRSSTKSGGAINFTAPHAPLLFIAGEKDHIIPASLNRKNFEAYTDRSSRTDFKVFDGRTHYICAQAGWEEVAGYVADWVH